MALSRKTVVELREYLASVTLREIRDLFDAEGIRHRDDFELPPSGQRRSLASAYLENLNLDDPDDVARLLKLFEHVLVKLSGDIEDYSGTHHANAAEQSQRNLLRWLRRDGFDFEAGRLVAVEARPVGLDQGTTSRAAPAQEPNPGLASPEGPTAFVSYSWDGDSHQDWVRAFAARLRERGINAKLDRWELSLGDPLPEFMERAVRENDFVLIVLTPNYREKSDGRRGGVGYESNVMTAELFNRADHRKFIPILREGSWTSASPSWLCGKVGVDLRGESYLEQEFERLIATLRGERETAPPLGQAARGAKRGESTDEGGKTSPLLVEVSSLEYDDVSGDLMVVTGTPRRFLTTLEITNQTERPVSLKRFSLKVGQTTLLGQQRPENARIDPFGYSTLQVCFAVNGTAPPPAGAFELMVVPAVGEPATVSGTYPKRTTQPSDE